MNDMHSDLSITINLTDSVIDQIADRAAEKLTGRQPRGWLNVESAARHIGYLDPIGPGKQRIYDLVAQHRIRFAKDGRRLLFRAEWLDDYLDAGISHG